MTGRELWELYNSYGEVYSQPLNEEVEVEEGYVDAYKAPSNYQRPRGSSMLGHPANLSPAMRAAQKSDQLQTTEPGSKRQKAQTRSSQQLDRLYGSARRAGNVNASYEYDLYDLVLEYLLDQGLCESVENAEIMMAHMSEQWIDSIIEEGMEEMPHLRQAMKDALRAGNQEKVKEIAAKLSNLQPKAQTEIGAELKGLNRRKRG
jgi:hypothetical protein